MAKKKSLVELISQEHLNEIYLYVQSSGSRTSDGRYRVKDWRVLGEGRDSARILATVLDTSSGELFGVDCSIPQDPYRYRFAPPTPGCVRRLEAA